MPSPISRRPAGLLDLLLTQQQGANPRELLDTVQPIVDMSAFYESERLDVEVETMAITTLGVQTADAIDVPDGEYWKVLGVGASAEATIANQALGVTVLVRNVGNEFPVFRGRYHSDIDAGSQVEYWSFMLPMPIHFPSGSSFLLSADDANFGGQPINCTLRIFYVRMNT